MFLNTQFRYGIAVLGRSNHRIIGAGNGTQTRDLCLGKASLYQLSYSRNRKVKERSTVEGPTQSITQIVISGEKDRL